MNSRTLFTTILMTSILLTGTNHASAAGKDLSPSEAVTLINFALQRQPGADRISITTPYIERMRTDVSTEMELFFTGESHFLHLQPEPARDVYWEFRKRSDSFGRVANQRLMVIRINAFGMVSELLEKDIPEYHRRFPVQANDRFGISFPVSRTALALIERDRANDALDLIVRHVQRHDAFDSAYTAYQLPGQFIEVARENGRTREFIDLHHWVVSGLDEAIERRRNSDAGQIVQVEKLPGSVFRSLFEDSDLGYHGWTAEMTVLRDRLKAAAKKAD